MAGFSAVSTRRQLHPRAGAVGGRSASVFRRDFEIGHKAECELVSLAYHSGTTGAVQHCAPLSELHGLVQSPPRRSWSLQRACCLHVPSQPGPPPSPHPLQHCLPLSSCDCLPWGHTRLRWHATHAWLFPPSSRLPSVAGLLSPAWRPESMKNRLIYPHFPHGSSTGHRRASPFQPVG